ncbi:MAG: DNA modification methylase [Phycisphaerales bacterium]|nr:DNA modification methylase [Phycisphaerales bacterium]
MKLRTIAIKDINPAPYNPRVDLQPGDPRFEKLVKSVDEFGLVEPLVWNERTKNLVGGHQRLKVLQAQGAVTAPVVVVNLSPEREKALNLALNKIAGDWDELKLAELLNELVDEPDLDLDLTGFELDEAQSLIGDLLHSGEAPEDFDVDAALAAAGPPVTKPGDLIVLGTNPARQHRLLCGDCTNTEDVTQVMDGNNAILFATDPPYLVGYDGTNHLGKKSRSRRQGSSKNSKPADRGCRDWSGTYGVHWDDADANTELYDKFIETAVEHAIAPNAAWYCWHASRRQAMLEAAWTKHGAFVHAQIIWVKNRGILTRSWYLWQHEPCLMGWLKGNMPSRVEKRRLPTVWQVDTLASNADRPDHPTPKPLEVFEIPMRQHTRAGDICYEPFAGSGTQFIAAERMGRRCFGIEISPVYCDLIVRRFIAYAGEAAVAPDIAERYRLEAVKS